MNLFKKLCLLSIIGLLLVAAQQSEAQERGTLSSRAGRGGQFTLRKPAPLTRVSDQGRPLVLWRQQVVYRALNDTFVYRYQNKATARDEYSGPVMIFHTKNGQVRGGHVYQKRGN